MDKKIFTVHTDGGSRGNPGPAAAAYLIESGKAEIHKDSKYLGKTTNNVAEYGALLMAVEWIEKNFDSYKPEGINFYLDSELVVKQINGLYKVKDENIRKYYLAVKQKLNLLKSNINFYHVPRAHNSFADSLVNKELDSNI